MAADPYKSWSPRRRMAEALKKVVEDGWSQAEAARVLRISRPRLNEKVKEYRIRIADGEERSAEARAERAGVADTSKQTDPGNAPALGIDERRRVPPLKEFNELYFNNVLCGDCGDVRHETPRFHEEMMDALDDKSIKRLIVNVAPYHAKSTILSLRHPLHKICEDPNVRIALVSAGESLAADQLYQIQRHLEDPLLYEGAARNLIEDWGPFRGTEQWSKNQFWVAGRTSGHRDPTVRSFGLGSKIYGRRLDEVVMDDVFDLSNTRNPDTVAFNVRWITSELESRLGKAGRLAAAGTRVGPQDGYSQLYPLPGYHVIKYPCILDEDEGITLWPEHFDIEAAKHKRSTMSAAEWQLLYQNQDTLGADAAFTQEMLESCRDTSRRLGDFDPNWQLVAGLDPAGANKQSGYTALVLMGVDIKTGKRYLVDIVNALQLKAAQLKDQMFMWADQYGSALREFRVESNGIQSQLVQYNEEIVVPLTNKGIRIAPHITGRNKWDPQFGVESMAPLYYNRTISIPWGDIRSRDKVKELERQLLEFPIGQVTDLYMAMWFSDIGCREIYQRMAAPLFDPKAKVPKRMRNKRMVIDFGTGTARAPTIDELDGWSPRWSSVDFSPDPTVRRPLNVGVDDDGPQDLH